MARDGSGDPVDAFVRAHQIGLWRFCRVLGCPEDAADDIAQESLVIALQKDQHLAAPSAARAFLRQTARHLWLRAQRADQRRAARHATAAEAFYVQHLKEDDGAGWLEALALCLEELSPRARRALDLTYRDGLSRNELAAQLGMGEHGARTILQRTRSALRECIQRRRQS